MRRNSKPRRRNDRRSDKFSDGSGRKPRNNQKRRKRADDWED